MRRPRVRLARAMKLSFPEFVADFDRQLERRERRR